MTFDVPGQQGSSDGTFVVLAVVFGVVLLVLLVRGWLRARRVIEDMPVTPAAASPRTPRPPVPPHVRECLDLARAGHADRLRELITSRSFDPDLTDPDGVTPLMVAAAHGRCEVIAVLLELGADPNRLCNLGLTPLGHAVLGGSREAVRTLLAHGARPDLGDPSPRLLAERTGRTDLLAS